jgi:transposase-like protein
MSEVRKHFTPQEKVSLLKKHLLEKVSVSELCQQAGIQPTMFYRWQQEFFENGTAAFEHRRSRQDQQHQARIEQLEAKLQKKDAVLAELMQEHFALKKALGEP